MYKNVLLMILKFEAHNKHHQHLCPRQYCQQKTKKCSSATMVEILFMFSFGVAHSDDPFSDCKAVSKGKQTLV